MVQVGRESRPGTSEVEKGAIRRFAQALGETNPIYFDEAAARAAGFRSVVAPPAFAATLQPGSDLIHELTQGKQVLQAEQHFDFARPLVAGDVVTVRARLAELTPRPTPTGMTEAVVLEHEGKDGAGEIVFRSRTMLVLRPFRESQPGAFAPHGEV